MANVFPGDSRASDYDSQRATMVHAASRGYWSTCNAHGISEVGEDTVWLDAHRPVSKRLLGFVGMLGIQRLVLASINSITRYTDNGFCLEVSYDSERRSFRYLREAFDLLANGELPAAEGDAFEWYKYVEGVNVQAVPPDALPQNVGGFDRVPEDVAIRMGYDSTIPMHILGRVSTPNAAGYWAELCTPVPVPDTRLWPAD